MTRRTSAVAEPPKRGRPPLAPEERRASRVDVRLTADEHARYVAAAERSGVTLADEARRAWERLDRRKTQ